MAIDIHNLVAAVAPDIYCKKELRSKVKEAIKKAMADEKTKSKAYLKGAEIASLVDSEMIDYEKLTIAQNLFKKDGLKNPIEKHLLIYDTFGENLETIYFWILDFVNGAYGKTTKIVDNFVTSPSSAQFAEIGMRATRMQEEASKAMGAANAVVKSILNLVYDLKEFRMRLQLYDKLKSKDEKEKEAATISLKQVWMDTVDMKRGNTSLKAMAFGQGAMFVTLIDAFMVAKDENLKLKDGSDIDLNDRVKRILQQKIIEFNIWLKESESELRKRYEIEKTYLKSQVNTVKIYARWVKPYLRSAQKLEQNAAASSSLVNAFNTTILELKLIAEGKYDPMDDIAKGDLPKSFGYGLKKKYVPITIIEFNYRSVPERMQQGGYGMRGRVEIKFTSYALTDNELKILKEQVEKDDLGDILAQLEGATTESLEQIQVDIDDLLGDKKFEDKKKEESSDSNPFSALFSLFKSEEKKDNKENKKEEMFTKESEREKIFRSQAILDARKKCAKLYATYKSVHGMPTFPLPF